MKRKITLILLSILTEVTFFACKPYDESYEWESLVGVWINESTDGDLTLELKQNHESSSLFEKSIGTSESYRGGWSAYDNALVLTRDYDAVHYDYNIPNGKLSMTEEVYGATTRVFTK